MKKICWNTIGTGKINIILLNGWGINSNIWFFITKILKHQFKFYLIDLPGSGKNKNIAPKKIDQVIELLYKTTPKGAIWIGWSIGGLIVNYFALHYPKHILGIINVSSSPCFLEKKNWPGIKENIINNLYYNLKTKYYQTINSFLDLEKATIQNCVEDIHVLKKILSFQDKPNLELLKNNLEIILFFDLRLDMMRLNVPMLRIYGALDNLIPKKIACILDQQWPKTDSIIIQQAAHAPFITKKHQFCSILLHFNDFLK